MATKNIEVYINRDSDWQATLTDGGETWDISSATEITFTVKKEKSDTTAKFTKKKTTGGITWKTDGTDGIINIAINPTDTNGLDAGVYRYGVKVTLGGENYETLEGKFTIKNTVAG